MTAPILDRRTPPPALPLLPKPLPPYEQHTLSNGMPVYLVQFGTQPVVEVQLLFKSGHSYEELPGVDALTVKLFSEGTRNYSALALAEKLDELGAFFQTDSGFESAGFSLSVLTKRLPQALPLLQEILINATLPELEFGLLYQRIAQQLGVEAQKTNYQARRRFAQGLYGARHPYSRQLGAEELAGITLADVRRHAARIYHPGNATLLVAGLFHTETVMAQLEGQFGILPRKPLEGYSLAAVYEPRPTAGLQVHAMHGNQQTSLRVGHMGFKRSHPDYQAIRMATTLLGGYFGSRLMQNIREEKGYTYGVGASWSGMKYSGSFVVATDVGNDFVPDTLHQIRLEIERLQQDPVSQEELDVARNYLLGKMLADLETPFQIADILKNYLANELPVTEFEQGFRKLQALTPEDILQAAQAHYRPKEMLEVVCGQYPS